MKVVLKEASYFSNLRKDIVNGTRFFVETNGKEIEIKNLVNAFFPDNKSEFEKQLLKAYSGYRNEESYRAENDFLLSKPVNLAGEFPTYVERYLDMLDMYYYDDAEEYFSNCEEVEEFVAEIAPQALRVLIEPWKYGIDRRSARRGS